jgi:hypothetical protein
VIVLTAIGHMAETAADAVDDPVAVGVIADVAVGGGDVLVAVAVIVADAADLAADGTKAFATDLRGSARIEPND